MVSGRASLHLTASMHDVRKVTLAQAPLVWPASPEAGRGAGEVRLMAGEPPACGGMRPDVRVQVAYSNSAGSKAPQGDGLGLLRCANVAMRASGQAWEP